MATLGNRIHTLMKSRGLNQSSLGKMVGVSHVAIGNWCKDVNEPTGENIHYLSIALGTTVEYLVTGKEPEDVVLDVKLLAQSIRDVEEACAALGREINPQTKATIVCARYQLGGSPSFSEIVGLFD